MDATVGTRGEGRPVIDEVQHCPHRAPTTAPQAIRTAVPHKLHGLNLVGPQLGPQEGIQDHRHPRGTRDGVLKHVRVWGCGIVSRNQLQPGPAPPRHSTHANPYTACIQLPKLPHAHTVHLRRMREGGASEWGGGGEGWGDGSTPPPPPASNRGLMHKCRRLGRLQGSGGQRGAFGEH